MIWNLGMAKKLAALERLVGRARLARLTDLLAALRAH